MKKVLSILLAVVMLVGILPFSAFAAEFINKIEINNFDCQLTDELTGKQAATLIEALKFPANAHYRNNNIYVKQNGGVIYDDKLVAGEDTCIMIEVFAEEYGMNRPNPSYDFDKDHLDQIEVWINGVKRTDVRVAGYNEALG